MVTQTLIPFGLIMPDLDGKTAVNPNSPIVVGIRGVGTRFSEIELRDEQGKTVRPLANQAEVALGGPLQYGTRYILKATAERNWMGQRETREIAFATAAVPKLDGPARRELGPDGAVTVQFDRPVGSIESPTALKLAAQPDQSQTRFRLIATEFQHGQTYSVDLAWRTPEGVQLPPLHLEIATPPPLSVEVNNDSQSNIGLGMPVQLSFSEPLANRDSIKDHVSIRTSAGTPITGRWSWINKQRVRFTPEPNWPPTSTINVAVDPQGPKSVRGGGLDHPVTAAFTTGSDRRIVVYLSSQKAVALENGQPVKTFNVSTGKAKTPTVTGSFYIYARFPVKTMRSRAKPGEKGHYVVENVPYAQYFYEDYAFHGAWWHNGFGRPASHGCVNMSTKKHNRRWPRAAEDAGWLYQWASIGVPVTVTKQGPTQVAMQ